MSPPNTQSVSLDEIRFRAEDVAAFVVRMLCVHDVPADHAAIVARCLVRADLRGVASHGVGHLAIYLERLRAGSINPRPVMQVQSAAPVAAFLDAQDGFGFVAGTLAMAAAVDMARTMGFGAVAVRRSTHFGMAASYVLQAVESGMMALVFTNASPAIPPWGGRTPLLGTSPLAAGVPGAEGQHFILDMSPAIMARGRIRRAHRLGEAIPPGCALDATGRVTCDPAAALAGSLLPIGGPKGAALSMVMDLFAGVFTGAAFAGEVASQYQLEKRQDVGHLMLAMRPDLFMQLDVFIKRMSAWTERMRSCPPAEGFSQVRLPGDSSSRLEQERREQGIPYRLADLEKLRLEAARAGVDWIPNRHG